MLLIYHSDKSDNKKFEFQNNNYYNKPYNIKEWQNYNKLEMKYLN